MNDKIAEKQKWISFISSFSKKELALNGLADDSPNIILNIYDTFAPFVKEGHYLELGCGTGILASYLNKKSENKIVPHGVDININSVEIAKKNNLEFANNFIHQDYFKFLKSNFKNLKQFSTINIFVNSNKQDWKKLEKSLIPIIKKCESTNFIITCYEYDFINNKTKEVVDFISKAKKITKISIASNSVMVISKENIYHTVANKIRRKTLKERYECIVRICKLANLSETELIMTHLGHRPATASALEFDSKLKNNLSAIRKHAREVDLYMAISYKFITDKNKIIENQKNESHAGRLILAFSKSKNIAVTAAKYFYLKSFDNTIGEKFGKLMGYPDCCLEFGKYLCDSMGKPGNFGYKNPGIESFKRSNKFDWHLNIFTTNMLSHFPCSLTCSKSIKSINKLLRYFDFVDKAHGRALKDLSITPASLYWSWVDRILLYGYFKSNKLGTGEINYYKIEPMIYSNVIHQENEDGIDIKWKNIEEYLCQGNRLIVSDDSCTIYSNNKKIIEIKKSSRYLPLLIKPNILPNETN